jgi:alkylation response protein AidB-like acyl-CoA dehydrogenase
MLASCEMMISHCIEISKLMDAGNSTMGHTARAKANCSLQAREVCQLAREVCGGNGIILDNHVMKSLLDIEGVYTYEGTYEINSLISARELTGGLAAIR